MAQTVKCLPTMQETRVRSLGWEIPWRKKWQPTPVFLPGKSHGQRSPVGYSPWGRKESETTEPLHFTSLHFSMRSTMCTLFKTAVCSSSLALHPQSHFYSLHTHNRFLTYCLFLLYPLPNRNEISFG